jgi:hypothetical protein
MLVPDLSPCKNLVEIRGKFAHAEFEKIIPMLKTVASPRFRKLIFIIIPPIPTVSKGRTWRDLDEEISALAKRVNAGVASDKLEVLFSSCSAILGGVAAHDIERFLPRVASDSRVSLRVENPARS